MGSASSWQWRTSWAFVAERILRERRVSSGDHIVGMNLPRVEGIVDSER